MNYLFCKICFNDLEKIIQIGYNRIREILSYFYLENMIKFKSTKQIIDYLEENSPETILFDGHEDSIVGVMETHKGLVCVYDRDKVIKGFIKDGMNHEEAEEFYDYNVIRTAAYMGELAPVFLMGIK